MDGTWFYERSPLIDPEPLLDCLRLASKSGSRPREVGMRASPYDLSDYEYSPITVERRAEYVRCQSTTAQRAASLRAALSAWRDLLLGAVGCG